MRAWSRRALRPCVRLSLLLASLLPQACGEPQIPLQPSTGIIADYTRPAVAFRRLPDPEGSDGAAGEIRRHADGMVAIAGLPWYRQGRDRTCAQANIAALLRYWGQPVTYAGIVEAMNPVNLPTDIARVAAFLNRRGLQARLQDDADLDVIKAQVRRGRPVIVLIDLGAINFIHYVTVKGFNDRTGHLLLSDPVNGPNVLMAYDEFERRWQNRSLEGLPGFEDRYDRIAITVGPASDETPRPRQEAADVTPRPSKRQTQ